MYIWTEQEQVPPPHNLSVCEILTLIFWWLGGGMKGFQMWNIKD